MDTVTHISMTDDALARMKRTIALRSWLLGKEWHTASKAFDYASKFHTGTRKDGYTPAFFHQIGIALYAKTIHKGLLHPEETLATIFLHDVPEDFDVEYDVLKLLFGHMITSATKKLTKKHKGIIIPLPQYYEGMIDCPIASVAKPIDRFNNQQNMTGVFSLEKQIEYMDEVEDFIFPMLKQARRNFPQQEPVYENLKYVLECQIQLIREIHNAR